MRCVDLFSGCGGLSLGFQNKGFDIVGAFENWQTAVDCYKENFSHPVFNVDLSDTETAIKVISALGPDIIVGGPPCQDYSSAGKRIEASRASLTEDYATIVVSIKPPFFIMENVDQARKSQAYAKARKIFKDTGYGLTETILDASLCGAPQKRKRFICFGKIEAEDNFALEEFTRRLSKKPTTIRDYYGNSLGFEHYYRHPRNYNRRAIFSIDEPAPTMRGVNRPVPKGYKGHPKDTCSVSDDLHALTTLDRALIQTFPRDFKWIGSKTDIEQMIGNAVPVKLAEYVAETVLNIAENKNSGQ